MGRLTLPSAFLADAVNAMYHDGLCRLEFEF